MSLTSHATTHLTNLSLSDALMMSFPFWWETHMHAFKQTSWNPLLRACLLEQPCPNHFYRVINSESRPTLWHTYIHNKLNTSLPNCSSLWWHWKHYISHGQSFYPVLFYCRTLDTFISGLNCLKHEKYLHVQVVNKLKYLKSKLYLCIIPKMTKRIINSPWDSQNFILRQHLIRYKTVLVTGTVHAKSSCIRALIIKFHSSLQ